MSARRSHRGGLPVSRNQGCARSLTSHSLAAACDGRMLAFGPKDGRVRDGLARALGWLLLVLCVLAVQSALALAFDPRYRDFPFAPLTCAAVPFLLIALLAPRSAGIRPIAEKVAALVLVCAAVAIAINEGFANWQAVWCCAALAATAFSLARARLAQG